MRITQIIRSSVLRNTENNSKFISPLYHVSRIEYEKVLIRYRDVLIVKVGDFMDALCKNCSNYDSECCYCLVYEWLCYDEDGNSLVGATDCDCFSSISNPD